MADRDPNIASLPNRPGYDEDFAAWISSQADALRDGRFDDLDIDELVDEVESLGKSVFRSFMGAVEIVLLHMLKWDYQPERRGEPWRSSIREHRARIISLMKENPSFKVRTDEAVARAYPSARLAAERQTGVFLQLLPKACPYDWDTIMTRLHELPDDWSYPEDVIS